ncbi:MAG: hypothetical protein ACI39U_07725 [Candidatus Cryptobacteroides sp.]
MEGLDKFREAFAEFSDNYVIIGGTACSLAMEGTIVRPRATHDIDMIVVVENMNAAFANQFWQFVREAGYRPEKRKQVEGEPPKYEMYRFLNGKEGYPEMIELLSRHQDSLGGPTGLVIEPVPTDDDISSLSAIIMDDDYYRFTIIHSGLTDGIRHADPAALIALKTRAYLNLVSDRKEGKIVNTKDIKKHRSDVLKNAAILTDEIISAPSSIVSCVHEFVAAVRDGWSELSSSLASALDQDTDFVSGLLEQLEYLFVEEISR